MSKAVQCGNVTIGGGAPVSIQSMTNVDTRDIKAVAMQINDLASEGCQIVRVAVPDMESAEALKTIKQMSPVPIVADIHFDHRLAIKAIQMGADKIRINPGNIGAKSNVEAVVKECQKYNVPIRIGINSGSLEKELYEKYGRCCPEAMIESAQKHIDILEELGFHDICLSFKSSNVPITIDTYRLAAEKWNYPLHLGLTEAGTKDYSLIKSSAALGTLLHDGIGDTIRISISDDCTHEVEAAKKLLKAFDLIKGVPDLVSCPTCGRLQYDVMPIMHEVEDFLKTVHSDIKVAVMGCVVNGPGEARDADIGVAGGNKEAILFRHGEIVRKIKQEEIMDTLKKEILALTENGKD